jgi:hypothetical protein
VINYLIQILDQRTASGAENGGFCFYAKSRQPPYVVISQT